MKVNLNSVKTFFDPHPGFSGAIIPIPTAVKEAANKLNNQRMSLRKAILKIKAVTNGTVTVSIENNLILLELRTPSGLIHMFRVVRFR